MGKIKEGNIKNIYFERDGVYRIEISNGFRSDGTRDKIIEYFYGNENDAVKRRDNIKAELKVKKQAGMNAANDGYTLIEAAKMYLEDRNYKKRAGTTIKGYKRYLNDYLLPEFGHKKLRNITEKDLEKLYKKMRETISQTTGKPIAGTTIKHVHSVIKAIYNYAIHRKWLLYNPAMHVDNKPLNDTPERDYYDYDEITNALNCIDKMPTHLNGYSDKMLASQNLRFKTAITLLFNTGLRKEELFGLKWKDIKWNSKVIEIWRAVVAIEADYFHPDDVIEIISDNMVCKKLKTDESRRNITVAQVCFDLLLQYKEDQIKDGKNITDEDWIWQEIRLSGIWNPNHLTKEWARFVKNFELKKITLYDIRHSHATYLLSIGVPIQDVSRRLGHSDIATTLKTYTHSNLEQDKKISNLMENNFYNTSNDLSYKLDFSVVASIITGKNYVDEEELYKGLAYLTNREINEDNLFLMTETCKSYILDNHNYLRVMVLIMDEFTNKSKMTAFFELMNNTHANICRIEPLKL